MRALCLISIKPGTIDQVTELLSKKRKIAKNEKVRKENIAMKQILKNLPNKIAEPYFEIWIEYQKILHKNLDYYMTLINWKWHFKQNFIKTREFPKKNYKPSSILQKRKLKAKIYVIFFQILWNDIYHIMPKFL